MMLDFWQFVRGHVRLEVTGFTAERFINMAAFRGVYLWDVERTERGVRLNVSIRGFKMLRGCARKTKCRAKIVEKNGLPFLAHRYRKRKALAGGVLFFVAGLIALSMFVWEIEIEGNERVSQDSLLEFLETEGLHSGALKFRLSDSEIRRAILDGFDEIIWADVHTRGTRTQILISESLPAPEMFDRQTPVHIVASSEGLITGIATAAGSPLVRQNDIVREGDMLVSGILTLDPEMPDSPSVYVHADAEVWARRFHTLEFTVPLAYEEKNFTGRTARQRVLNVLNFRINLPGGGNNFESYDRITTYSQVGAGGHYPLPLILVTEIFSEFTPTPRTRTPKEAELLAERMVTSRIIREFDFGVDIVGRELQFNETPDILNVRALITTHERIDRQVPIVVPTPTPEPSPDP
ncbi:MAG: sporulation protein YqfD [Defluviitaleaceae bacterium]|nr:sporulation protein YqfD [Defluviitaleaceae bacterium]